MGQLKKYEAHTRYPCCCCAVDVKKSVLTLSITGLIFILIIAIASAVDAIFYSHSGPSIHPRHEFVGVNVLLSYGIAFAAIIFGVVTNRPSYLTIFLVVNGFMIAFLSCILALVLLFVLVSDSALDQLGYPGVSVQIWQLKQYILSSNLNMTQPFDVEINATEIADAPQIIVVSGSDAFYYAATLALSITATLWVAVIFVQGLVFHAFRSLRLRKQFEYNPYNARNLSSPITMQHNGTNNGIGVGNNYISSIKRSLFPKRI